jgi:hypothetical protein
MLAPNALYSAAPQPIKEPSFKITNSLSYPTCAWATLSILNFVGSFAGLYSPGIFPIPYKKPALDTNTVQTLS